MSRELSAVVVGGGIGGLAAAAALGRSGVRVTILERGDGRREPGAGLSLSPNAYRALEALGVAEEVERAGASLEAAAVVRADGRPLSRAAANLRRQFGAPGLCVRRGDLLAALARAVSEDALVLGAPVQAVEQDESGVAAVLESGVRLSGDILVGADGLRSAVRRQLGRGGPRFCGALAWRGVAAGAAAAAAAGAGGGLAVGRDAHAGWMPAGSGEMYWFACVNAPEGTEPPGGDARWEVLARFGSWPAPLPDLVRSTPPEALLRHDLYEHEPVDGVWGAGRITLLGDAAHAMTPGLGQGACAALEDAVVLARCLRRRTDAIGAETEALRDYERRRQPRVARLQRESAWALRALQPRSRLGGVLRDLALRLPAGWAARGQGWVFRYDPAAA